jgi:hypothetical protein
MKSGRKKRAYTIRLFVEAKRKGWDANELAVRWGYKNKGGLYSSLYRGKNHQKLKDAVNGLPVKKPTWEIKEEHN